MKIAVVIPVYNEERAIKKVITEWYKELKKYNFFFKILIINDGSTDNTQKIINKIRNKRIKIFHNNNSGHGKACFFGYKYAIKENFTHILQIDSDGQCNPRYFQRLFNEIVKYPVVYGYRKKRKDGILRKFFSRVMEFLIYLRSFKFIKDPNSPYRMIKCAYLKKAIKNFPKNVDLSNVYLTFLLSKIVRIHYVPIVFSKRYYGKSKYGFTKMLKSLINLLLQSY